MFRHPCLGFIDSDGKQLPTPLELTLDLTGRPAAEAAAYGFLKVVKANASGTTLHRKKSFIASNDIANKYEKITRGEDDFFAEHPQDGVRIKMIFENPGSAVTKASVAGSFKLRTGGQQQVVAVKNVSSHSTSPERQIRT